MRICLTNTSWTHIVCRNNEHANSLMISLSHTEHGHFWVYGRTRMLALSVYAFMRLWGGLIFGNQLSSSVRGATRLTRPDPSSNASIPEMMRIQRKRRSERASYYSKVFCVKKQLSRVLPEEMGRAWGYLSPHWRGVLLIARNLRARELPALLFSLIKVAGRS
jgi:hypothetical protein